MTNETEYRIAKLSLKELLKGKESKFARYVAVNSTIIICYGEYATGRTEILDSLSIIL